MSLSRCSKRGNPHRTGTTVVHTHLPITRLDLLIISILIDHTSWSIKPDYVFSSERLRHKPFRVNLFTYHDTKKVVYASIGLLFWPFEQALRPLLKKRHNQAIKARKQRKDNTSLLPPTERHHLEKLYFILQSLEWLYTPQSIEGVEYAFYTCLILGWTLAIAAVVFSHRWYKKLRAQTPTNKWRLGLAAGIKKTGLVGTAVYAFLVSGDVDECWVCQCPPQCGGGGRVYQHAYDYKGG